MKTLITAIAYVTGMFFFTLPQRTNKIEEYPLPNIRERQTVIVNGAEEVWELQWKGKIKDSACGLGDTAFTRPCEGFGYAEAGDMALIRRRSDGSMDKLPITPLFDVQFPDDGQVAIIQRWEALRSDRNSEISDAEIKKRPPVRVMHFGDYDHDGNATEFYLQTESAPCGKSTGIVIGVSKTNSHLHATLQIPLTRWRDRNFQHFPWPTLSPPSPGGEQVPS